MSSNDDSSAWKSYLFLGTHGHVAAVDRASGRRVWTTSLPRTGYDIVSILVEDGVVYCGSRGRLFAVDATSGRILWNDDLSGLGYDAILLATERSPVGMQATSAAVQAEEDARRRRRSS